MSSQVGSHGPEVSVVYQNAQADLIAGEETHPREELAVRHASDLAPLWRAFQLMLVCSAVVLSSQGDCTETCKTLVMLSATGMLVSEEMMNITLLMLHMLVLRLPLLQISRRITVLCLKTAKQFGVGYKGIYARNPSTISICFFTVRVCQSKYSHGTKC